LIEFASVVAAEHRLVEATHVERVIGAEQDSLHQAIALSTVRTWLDERALCEVIERFAPRQNAAG
jgi:hypothetical protein